MKKTVSYHSGVRFVGAFIASVYMLFHGRPFDLIFALTTSEFYLAFIVSFGIALILVQIVHSSTLWLDRRICWRRHPVERSIMQFTLGVVLPLCVDLLIISVYFYSRNEDILTNGFLLIDFPLIASFIIFLNIYYLIHHLLQTETKEDEAAGILTIRHNGLYRNLNVAEEVFYIYRLGKQITLITFDGDEYNIDGSLKALEKRFGADGMIRINRSVIFNFNIVQGYENGGKRNTLKLITERKYEDILTQYGADRFIVTNEHIGTVMEWFPEISPK